MEKLKPLSKKTGSVSKKSLKINLSDRDADLKNTEKFTRDFIRRYRKDLESLAKK